LATRKKAGDVNQQTTTPASMDRKRIPEQNLLTWMLDTNYACMCFYATQVFLPKTADWDNLQKSLNAEFKPWVRKHMAGTVCKPLPIGPKCREAAKVTDERGNERKRLLSV
jgi:adenine-specific DNA-methyltransferase